jgi:hypothetical protein
MANGERALIVSDNVGLVQHWGRWLRGEGYEVTSCAGPGITLRCPALEGSPCPAREAADVAVVEGTTPGARELYAGFPERSCVRQVSTGGTVFVFDPPVRPRTVRAEVPTLTHPVTRQGLSTGLYWARWGLAPGAGDA